MLPSSLCSTLDQLLKDFWWGFPKEKRFSFYSQILVQEPHSWKSICLPTPLDGLGIRNMKGMNKSRISQLGWKLLTNHNCLWVSQLQIKYHSNVNFLNSSSSRNCSWFWKGTQKAKPLVATSACFQTHPLSSPYVWHSPWIPQNRNFKPKPLNSLTPLSPTHQISNLICPRTKNWISPLIHNLFDIVSATNTFST